MLEPGPIHRYLSSSFPTTLIIPLWELSFLATFEQLTQALHDITEAEHLILFSPRPTHARTGSHSSVPLLQLPYDSHHTSMGAELSCYLRAADPGAARHH